MTFKVFDMIIDQQPKNSVDLFFLLFI